jgi:hypothetical protein
MSAAAFRDQLQGMTFMPAAFVRYLQAGADGMTPKAREQILAKFGKAAKLAAAAVQKGKDRVAAIR